MNLLKHAPKDEVIATVSINATYQLVYCSIRVYKGCIPVTRFSLKVEFA